MTLRAAARAAGYVLAGITDVLLGLLLRLDAPASRLYDEALARAEEALALAEEDIDAWEPHPVRSPGPQHE